MTATSAASTLGESWNTQLSEFRNRLDFCPPLHAADLPEGRILVVEDETIVALDLQPLLREAGYRIGDA